MSRLLAYSKANPLTFGVVFSTIKTSAADLLVQLQFEKKKFDEIDWRRNSAFALFGCFYLGGVQYALYVPIFGRMFPKAAEFAAKPIAEKLKDPKGIFNMLTQVFLDQCVHHPLAYFPVFYSVKEVVGGGSISDGLAKYQKNIWEDLLALWKVWVPATMFNFTFSPMWLRIPCVATTSLLWTCILSAMRGDDAPPLTSEEAAAAIGAQGRLLLRENRPRELDPNLDHVIVIATGHDGPGRVSALTKTIHESAQGNVSESKMVKMGGHLMAMMVVSLPGGAADKVKLEQAMEKMDFKEGLNLDVRVVDITDSNRAVHSNLAAGLRRYKTAPGTRVTHFDLQVSCRLIFIFYGILLPCCYRHQGVMSARSDICAAFPCIALHTVCSIAFLRGLTSQELPRSSRICLQRVV